LFDGKVNLNYNNIISDQNKRIKIKVVLQKNL